MLFKPFYGRLFFSPDGDGGGAGGEDAGDDSNGGGDDNGGSDDDPIKAAERDRDTAKAEAKRVDKLLRAAQARVAELENAGKPEAERLTADLAAAQRRAEDAETKLRTANARSAVTVAAANTNAVDADAVFALVRDDLDYDEDGAPTNVTETLAALKTRKPHLFKASGGRGNGSDRDASNDTNVGTGVDRMRHAYQTTSKTAERR